MVKKAPPPSSSGPKSKSKPKPKPKSKNNTTTTATAKSKTTAGVSPSQPAEDDEIGPPPSELKAQQQQQQQQTLLDIFSAAFGPSVLGSETFAARLQELKQALYNRDFGAAFGREDLLEAYAARWSPTRALCYARVLRDVGGYLEALVDDGLGEEEEGEEEEGDNDDGVGSGSGGGSNGEGSGIATDAPPAEEEQQQQQQQAQHQHEHQKSRHRRRTLRMFAIGGGAAETVAFGSYLASPSPSSSPSEPEKPPQPPRIPISGTLHLLDTGPWGRIITALHARLTSAPPLSKYASAAARAASAALVAPAGRLTTVFAQRDALGLDEVGLSRLLYGEEEEEEGEEEGSGLPGTAGNAKGMEMGPGTGKQKQKQKQKQPVLVTLLFTLNELYTAAGVGPTTAFLRRLTAVVCPGSLLLVVDSPGSYSEAAVGGGGASSTDNSTATPGTSESGPQQQQQQNGKRRYPMQWLLDHTLLEEELEHQRMRRRRRQRRHEQERGLEQEREMKMEEQGREELLSSSSSLPHRQGNGDGDNDRDNGEDSPEVGDGGRVEGAVTWEKLESADSVWFRLAEGLRYPIPLENMRYQMHLYRACRPCAD